MPKGGWESCIPPSFNSRACQRVGGRAAYPRVSTQGHAKGWVGELHTPEFKLKGMQKGGWESCIPPILNSRACQRVGGRAAYPRVSTQGHAKGWVGELHTPEFHLKGMPKGGWESCIPPSF